jgi:histidinol-phosphate/aromatic aminotransferase/cobyric acid decarboxylase-like protein
MNQAQIKKFSGRYGGYWRDDVLDFCYLTNPYFPSPKTLDALFNDLRRAIKFYPSTQSVIAGYLAGYLGIPHRQLFVSNGGSESITILNRLNPGCMLIPVPAFNEYENNRLNTGAHVRTFDCVEERGFQLDVDAFIAASRRPAIRSALVITPNNPTGNVLSKAEVFHLMEKTRHLDMLVVDESFINFSYEKDKDTSSVLRHLEEYPHVVVLCSMSKDYGIPGLRIGYLASGDPDRITRIRKHSPIWNINVFAEIFLEKLPQLKAEFERSRLKVISSTQKLCAALKTVPFLEPRPTFSNFIFAKVLPPFNSTSLYETLLTRHDIFINDTSNKPNVGKGFVRIASRNDADNGRLVAALRRLRPA